MKKHKVTKFCNHPAYYVFGKVKVEGWCLYCRLKTFKGTTNKELAKVANS